MKKILLILLASLLCFAGCEAVEPQTQEVVGTDGLQYEITSDSTGYIVTGYIGSEKDIVIPENYESLPVVEIKSSSFYENQDIESVYISSNVKKVGDKAFSNCYNLKTIFFNEGLNEIGANAFAGTIVEKVVLPKSVTLIDQFAFASTRHLHYVKINNPEVEIRPWAFDVSKYLNSPQNWSKSGLYIDNILVLMPSSFYPENYIHQMNSTITTREGIETISWGVLRSNRFVANVIIAEGTVTIFGKFATSCESLVSISLPNTLEYI